MEKIVPLSSESSTRYDKHIVDNTFFMKLSKNEKTAVFVALVVIAIFFLATSIAGFFFRGSDLGINASAVSSSDNGGNDLQIETITSGTGTEAEIGDTLTVHYVGQLSDGTVFDSSRSRGAPFVFTLGAGKVIAGWDLGLQGIKVGGIRRLIIPSELGYGPQGIGPIPTNATLIFEVELLDVEKAQ